MAHTAPPSVSKETIRHILSCALQEQTTASDGSSFNELSDVMDVLEEIMTSCMQNVITRFQSYNKKCQTLKKKDRFDSNHVRKRLLRTENYLMEKFHQKEEMILYTTDSSQHRHIMAWRKCYPSITKNLCSLGVVLDHLMQDDVLSVADKNSIGGKGTPLAQNEEFFRCIEGRTEEEFYNSVIPAIKSENEHLAEVILKTADEVEERLEDFKCTVCLVHSSVQVKKLATPLFQADVINSALHADIRSSSLSNRQKWKELKNAKVSDEQIIQAMQQKYPEFYLTLRKAKKKTLDCFCGEECDTVSNASGIFSKDPSNASLIEDNPGDIANIEELDDIMFTERLEYPMNARPRGYCVVINSELLYSPRMLQARNINVKKAEEIFKTLEFKVLKYENLTSDMLTDCLKNFAKETDHAGYNAFVCCLFCHCEGDQITACDGGSVPIHDLTGLFAASSCPSLAGKPKLFFIDSPRGNKSMNGFKLLSGPQPNSSNVKDEYPSHHQNVISDEADFCIAYSTVAGFNSFINPTTGSWFIDSLFQILDSQADQHDLLSCLSMVNEKVAKRSFLSRDKQAVQTPVLMSTLTRRVNLMSNST